MDKMVVFNDVFGIFGFCSQLIYDIIPWIFWCQLKSGVLKDKKLSIISIFCLYINAFIYFIFCVVNPKNEIEVMDFCNLQGTYLGIVYIILYYKHMYYQDNKLKFYIIVCLLIISSVIVGVIEYLLRNEEIFVGIINWIGVIFNIGEYLPIGFDYFYLVKNKISEKYTLLGAYVGIINTILWLIWSIIKTFTTTKDEQNNVKKYHSFVANIFGLFLCLSQLGLYYKYKKDDIKKNDDYNIKKSEEKIIENDSSTENNYETFKEDEYSGEKKN
jgi:hypothetical protein